jgi:hypothetical protein
VSRVVAGRLFYVETDPSKETLAVTPDRLWIKRNDGSLARYRGEPFKSIGLEVGASVTISESGAEKTIVVDNHSIRAVAGLGHFLGSRR